MTPWPLVGDEHVAAVRALILGQADEADRRGKALVASGADEGYERLVFEAFRLSVQACFRETPPCAVIAYVARLRVRLADTGSALDPNAAEHVIRQALGDRAGQRPRDEERARTQVLVLVDLVSAGMIDVDDLLASAQLASGITILW